MAHQAYSAFPLRADYTLRIISCSNAALAYFCPQIQPYCVHAMELYQKQGNNLEEDLQIFFFSESRRDLFSQIHTTQKKESKRGTIDQLLAVVSARGLRLANRD